jgi:NAD(P)-dependent dehydrogenase (short-subunit alcohol dehydrogenase family)
MKLTDTVAIVTGGASGLGEATCRHLVALGARVVALDVNRARGEALAAELGERCLFAEVDITDDAQVQRAVEAGRARFGTVNAVVAAAGIAGPAKLLGRNGPLPMDKFDKVVKVNLYGTLHVFRAAAQAMLANTPNDEGERGVLIAVSSGAAYEGQVGQIAYSASKAALVGMTLPLARELGAHGIRVMTIAPGAFDTPIYDTVPPAVRQSLVDMLLFPKRLGRASEFAMLVEELLRNPLHNGRTYRFDGGAILASGN